MVQSKMCARTGFYCSLWEQDSKVQCLGSRVYDMILSQTDPSTTTLPKDVLLIRREIHRVICHIVNLRRKQIKRQLKLFEGETHDQP